MVRRTQSRNDFDSRRRVTDISGGSSRLPGAWGSFAKRSGAAFDAGLYADGRFFSAPRPRLLTERVERFLGGTDGRTREDQHPCRRGPILHGNRRSDDRIPDWKSTVRSDIHEPRASRDGYALRRRSQWDAVPATISGSSSSLRPLAVEPGSECPVVSL